MFGWFRPRSPLEAPEKLWIEQRMSWLVRTFGLARLRDAVVVLPTPEFFPAPYDGTEATVPILFRRVCEYMGVDPWRFNLSYFEHGPEDHPDALGLYVPGEREQVLVARSQLADPMALVGTLAHEIAHGLLLGDGLLGSEESDQEYVTDLLTVFVGLGVFGANSVIRETIEAGHRYSWSISRSGYLSERMYGYALAVFAWARGEEEPAWLEHLRPNVRAVCRKGLDYLVRTRDTQFRTEEEPSRGSEAERLTRWIADLQSPSSGARLAALWALRDLGDRAATALPQLIERLQDSDASLRTEAAEVIGGLGPAAEAAVPALLDASLQDEDDLVVAAVGALGKVGRRADVVVPTLVHLLGSTRPNLRVQAAWALGRFGAHAAAAVDRLAPLVQNANEDLAYEAARALGDIGPPARPAVSALLQTLKEGEGNGPVAAAYALGRIAPEDPAVAAALRRALAHGDLEVAEEARKALGLRAHGNPAPKRSHKKR
jgi:hypothetical protein